MSQQTLGAYFGLYPIGLRKAVLRFSKGYSQQRLRARKHWPLCLATGGRVFVAGYLFPKETIIFKPTGVARPRHRQSVFVAACCFLIIIFYVAATCRPSVLGSATKTRPPVAKQSSQCVRALIAQNVRQRQVTLGQIAGDNGQTKWLSLFQIRIQ